MQYALIFDRGGALFGLGSNIEDERPEYEAMKAANNGCIRSEGYSSYVTLSTANRLIDAHSVILVF